MFFDVKKEIEKMCAEQLERWAEWNAEDADRYLVCNDTNRYLISLNKRGWAVPFILSDFKDAKQSLYTEIKYKDEFKRIDIAKGQFDEFAQMSNINNMALELTFERQDTINDQLTKFKEFFRSGKMYMVPDLERSVFLSYTKRTDLFPEVYSRFRDRTEERADDFSIERKTYQWYYGNIKG